MTFLSSVKRAFLFYKDSKTIYNVHSPFVYDFMVNVFDTSKEFYVFNDIEKLRKALLKTHKKIPIIDYGAGSKSGNKKEKSISEIARLALSGKQQCRMLFNIVNHYKPKKILEMGTSLGISTLYLASSDTSNKVFTLEGNPSTAAIAKAHFTKMGYNNIRLEEGKFETTLPLVLSKMEKIDLAFIDGNHRKKPTIEYFNILLSHIDEESIVVFDDIHWSDEMTHAWNQIKEHPSVKLSIDLYSMGIVFFRSHFTEKQHFKLVKWWMKPWSVGIFG